MEKGMSYPQGYGYCFTHKPLHERVGVYHADQKRAREAAADDPVHQPIVEGDHKYEFTVLSPINKNNKTDNVNGVLRELSQRGLGVIRVIEQIDADPQLAFYRAEGVVRSDVDYLTYNVVDQLVDCEGERDPNIPATPELLAEIIDAELASGLYPSLDPYDS